MSTGLLLKILGREKAWRLGRSLYMASRRELNNAITVNGEAALIRRAIAHHRRTAPERQFVAFDIGANLGEWSAELVDAAAPLQDWRLEAFEPVAGSFARVSARFAGDARVRCNQIAISNRIGEAEMMVVGETSGTNSLALVAGTDATRVTVPVTTFAAHMASIGVDHVDLAKIDAEGHDIEILRNLGEVLAARSVGVVQFEYNWRWLASRGSLYEVFALIAGTDYALARVTPDGLAAFESWNAELDRYFEANYALVRRDLLEALGAARLRWDESNVAAAY